MGIKTENIATIKTEERPLSKYNQGKTALKKAFSDSDDLILREISFCGEHACFYFIDGMTDKELLETNVIKPLLQFEGTPTSPRQQFLKNTLACGDTVKAVEDEDDLIKAVAEGDIALLLSNGESYYVLSVRKYPTRSISEPPTESVLKGPREGFIEDVKTNVSMLRRRLRHPALTVCLLKIGRFSNTTVAVVYVSGIADDEVVERVKNKIKGVDIDGLVDSTYLSSYLESHPGSFFTEIGSTEKPDVLTAKILEGRIGIITDGSPIALTVPFILFEDYQDSYDYYSGAWRSSFVRCIRFMGVLLTVLLPGIYVALQTYHYHLLPFKFLVTLINATSGIPFTPPVEMLLVLTLFEILNQASIRMPRFMGISLSVVGAIVLGDTAVKAGLISSPAVLVTALSAIGIFCVPDQVAAISILRLLFLCISAVLGLYGIIIGLFALVGYMVSLNSYGAPYLAPFAPIIAPDLKDSFLKSEQTQMKRRPFSIPNKNRIRIK